MNDKSETTKAGERIIKTIKECKENKIESDLALELIEADLKIVISNLQGFQDKIDDLKKRKIINP